MRGEVRRWREGGARGRERVREGRRKVGVSCVGRESRCAGCGGRGGRKTQ